MKPRAILTLITVACVPLALAASLLYGKVERPYDRVGIKFCPKTANRADLYGEDKAQEAQDWLNNTYCRRESVLAKKVWEEKQSNTDYPLPLNNLVIRVLQAQKENVWWLLAAPCLYGVAYFAWAKRCDIDDQEFPVMLESYKSGILARRTNESNQRDFDTRLIQRDWVAKNQKAGFEAASPSLNDLRREQLIHATHKAALMDLAAGESKSRKDIAENLKDAAKADKEREKIIGKGTEEKISSSESPTKQLKADMIEALKSHEDGWLWRVIDNQKPLWVLGEAGSGKSTLAASIIMLRQWLFDMPLYGLVDAHAGDNLKKSWKYLNPPQIAQTEEHIAEAFDDARERWLDRINNQPNKKPQQFLVDEFTNYSESEVTKDAAKRFVKASLSDPRKADEWLVCIAHFFTNTATGGSDGTAKGRARGTIQIDRKTADGKTPLPHATVNGLNNEEGEAIEDLKVKIPAWLIPEKINGHFSGKPIDF